MESSTLSIADLELEEVLCTSHSIFYDVLARKGRCRLVECHSSTHPKLVKLDLAIFEFVRVANLDLYLEDEFNRLQLLGDLKEPLRPLGERCLLSVSVESETSAALYYSIRFEQFVFRLTFGFARLERDDDPVAMAHSLVEFFLAHHANIGLRT